MDFSRNMIVPFTLVRPAADPKHGDYLPAMSNDAKVMRAVFLGIDLGTELLRYLEGKFLRDDRHFSFAFPGFPSRLQIVVAAPLRVHFGVLRGIQKYRQSGS